MAGELKPTRSLLAGAAFLMATSAIGPGFLTQTALFTSQLGTSFGFAILASIILDIGAQLSVWRVITVSGLRAQEIGNRVARGLGTFLAIAVAVGGLAFNIGNIAGCGLGLSALLGMDIKTGAIVSALVSIALFLFRELGRAMDKFTLALGFVMIALMLFVTTTSHPPLLAAMRHSVFPENIGVLQIVTLVGGTVGGYITFSGAHRLVDAGVKGTDSLPFVSRAATTGILVTALMRALLFLAALGVVVRGVHLDSGNPAGSVFRNAAGEIGYRVFGLVMWAAAVTSVVGASYTSTSFLKSFAIVQRRERATIIAFITAACALFLVIGRPVKTLVVVGALNGLILPIALATILIAAYRRNIVGDYRHPAWMTAYGAAVAAVMSGLAVYTITSAINQL